MNAPMNGRLIQTGFGDCEPDDDGEAYFEGELVVLRPGAAVALEASCSTRLMLLGGAPLDGERHLLWNFVGSDKEALERAKADWIAGRFPPVVGDDGPPIPYP